MTTKVFTLAHVPDNLVQAWLQHLRDFDTQHPGCHFDVMTDMPNMTMPELINTLRINPNLTFYELFMRRCPVCNGNDGDAPCAYPGEGKQGCLRDVRLGR